MGRVKAHPRLSCDDRRHPLGRPNVAGEAIRLGTPCQQLGDACPLLGREFRRWPRPDPVAQRTDASIRGALQLLADRAGRDPQRCGDRLLLPALLPQFPCPQSPRFGAVPRWTHRCRGHMGSPARSGPGFRFLRCGQDLEFGQTTGGPCCLSCPFRPPSGDRMARPRPRAPARAPPGRLSSPPDRAGWGPDPG